MSRRLGHPNTRRPIFACVGILCLLLGALPALAQSDELLEMLGTDRNHWTNDREVGRGLGPVTQAALRSSPQREAWLHFGGNYKAWRHSPITELDPDSIGDLEVAWTAQTGVSGQLEASPVVTTASST